MGVTLGCYPPRVMTGTPVCREGGGSAAYPLQTPLLRAAKGGGFAATPGECSTPWAIPLGAQVWHSDPGIAGKGVTIAARGPLEESIDQRANGPMRILLGTWTFETRGAGSQPLHVGQRAVAQVHRTSNHCAGTARSGDLHWASRPLQGVAVLVAALGNGGTEGLDEGPRRRQGGIAGVGRKRCSHRPGSPGRRYFRLGERRVNPTQII